jgi:hypothetical protein
MNAQEALAAVITAKDYVKAKIPLDHSDNKTVQQQLNTRPLEQRMQDVLEKKNTLDQMRQHQQAPLSAGRGVTKILKYGEYALSRGYGNCLEMACAAAWCLNNVLGEFDWDLVYYSATPVQGAGVNDHIFVALNQPGGHGVGYPIDFANWSASAAICDVWADIGCLAPDYPQRWRARMHNWHIGGIVIGNRLPTEAMWKDVVDTVKSSYIRGPL